MKKITAIVPAVVLSVAFLCSSISVKNSEAFSDTIGKKPSGQVKGEIERCKQYPTLSICQQAGKTTTPSGTTGAVTGSSATTSGSSEHSSVRGTINGGGDFIAPKLQPQKPKSVAPKLNR